MPLLFTADKVMANGPRLTLVQQVRVFTRCWMAGFSVLFRLVDVASRCTTQKKSMKSAKVL